MNMGEPKIEHRWAEAGVEFALLSDGSWIRLGGNPDLVPPFNVQSINSITSRELLRLVRRVEELEGHLGAALRFFDSVADGREMTPDEWDEHETSMKYARAALPPKGD